MAGAAPQCARSERILLALALAFSLACRATPREEGTSRRDGGPVTLVVLDWWLGESPQATINEALARQFTRQTGIAVKFVAASDSATTNLARYQALVKGPAPPDVLGLDVTWAGTFAEDMIDLGPELSQEARAHVAAIVENDTADGKLVAMPFFTDTGLLYYRTDLLKAYGFPRPPATWSELEKMAAAIQRGERAKGNSSFWGFVWEGAAYEGLTCNALEWQVSHGGGQIIERDRRISVNDPRTIRAFERAARWVGTISPPGITAYKEEDARTVWQSGNAAFMRNWPYAYAISRQAGSALLNKFDVTQLPSGGASRAHTLGGWQLGVSRRTAHPREAIAFVRYFTSPGTQAKRSIEGAFVPTIPAVLGEPDVLQANPFYARLRDVLLSGAVARPSTVTGKSYEKVSEAYFRAVHSILARKVDAKDAVARLERQLVEITGFPTGSP